MTSVNKILDQLKHKQVDWNNLAPDTIQEIFLCLTVRKIFLVCRTNKAFDSVCRKECLWRTKISSDYGISKQYEKTWMVTARMLCENNMINLEKKWVNGQTYREIMNKTFEAGDRSRDEMMSIVSENVERIMGEGFLDVTESLPSYLFDEELIRELYDVDLEDMFEDADPESGLKDLEKILTRELAVIAGVSSINEDSYSHFPRYVGLNAYPKSKRSSSAVFDWHIYIIDFSSLSRNEMLNNTLFVPLG